MRKFVKAAAVLALAFALLSTSAFAALTGDVTVNDGTYSLNVDGQLDGEQVTLLVTDARSLAEVTDANIWYIDQNDSGEFSNFQLKDGNLAGKELFFYAASTSVAGSVVDSVQNWLVSLNAGEATVEAGEELVISASVTGGDYVAMDVTPEWTVTSDNAAAAELTDGGKNGVTFKATAAGTYTVNFNTGITGVTKTIDIEVTAPSTALVKEGAPTIVATKPGDVGAAAEAQNGVGVELKIAEAKAEFTKMIWVFVTSEAENNRYYSEPVEIPGVKVGSQMTIRAAFANGNNTSARDVQSVDAIFTADDGVTSYYTNEAADAPNKDKQ